MKAFVFFAFIVSMAKAGLWIAIGVLIKNHFEALLTLITRKPAPENLIEQNKSEAFNNVIEWIGKFIILIGIGLALSAFATLIMGFGMPTNNINF